VDGFPGFTVNQELGKVLIMEESDHYDVFNERERSELIFKLLQHFALGGPVNQYDDQIGQVSIFRQALLRYIIITEE
jgi:hypothetical protein